MGMNYNTLRKEMPLKLENVLWETEPEVMLQMRQPATIYFLRDR